MSEPETRKMTLTVLSQRPVFKGTRGTLFAVHALDEDHNEVTDLRTFHPALPVNDPQEFEMTAYDHDEYGRTWTIKYEGRGLADRVGELERKIEVLISRVKSLERRLGDEPEEHVHPAQAEFGDGLPQGPSFGR